MGGKRINGRSGSGEAMYPRISSAGSTKSSPIESTSVNAQFNQKLDSLQLNVDLDNESKESPPLYRKNSFDIISLLAPEDSISKSENGNSVHKSSPTDRSTDLPSFWHFVEPDTKNDHDIFRRSIHNHQPINKDRMFATEIHHERRAKDVIHHCAKNSSDTIQVGKVGAPKRAMKRRKLKKVQSAKIVELKTYERGSERLSRNHREWLPVLTPPGTGSSFLGSANNDSEDELIKRYFSGLSSAGSSISWAEDAMESEFTTQLQKLWEDIETACAGGSRPEKMSDYVYQECMEWRKAFPNPDLHRFSSFRDDGELSSVESPTPEENRGDGDAAFSSLVHSSRSSSGGRKGLDENLQVVQANFRALNCSTPRPNIEKSTEYVSAWLSECQNSYVPEGNQPLLDHINNRSSISPILANNVVNFNPNSELEIEICSNKTRNGQIQGADAEKSSFHHYSRSHAKFVNEPDPTNFFTSMAISNSETRCPHESRVNFDCSGSPLPSKGVYMHNMPFELPRFSNSNGFQSRINESEEEDEDGSNTPTEIVSFRPNVRVQRPISSRIRDHAITPIATGTLVHSSFGGRNSGVHLSKQTTACPSLYNSQVSENYRFGGRLRMFESLNSSTAISAQPDIGAGVSRVNSGLVRQGHSLTSQLGRSKQQPWSRHSGDDLAAEANYVTSLYENYPSSIGARNIEEDSDAITNDANLGGPNYLSSLNSTKGTRSFYDRSGGIEGPHSLAESKDQSFSSGATWLMNR